MTTQQYECYQCKGKFDEPEPGSKVKAGIKCPRCGSTDVETVNGPSCIIDRFRSKLASSGG